VGALVTPQQRHAATRRFVSEVLKQPVWVDELVSIEDPTHPFMTQLPLGDTEVVLAATLGAYITRYPVCRN